MNKFEIGKCSRCQELYNFDDSSPKPIYHKSKLFKRKRQKLDTFNNLSPKDEAKKALTEEIKSCTENRNNESSPKPITNKKSKSFRNKKTLIKPS